MPIAGLSLVPGPPGRRLASSPSPTIGTAPLASEVDVGPLPLRPRGTRFVEYLRSETWRLDGVTVFETWPVIVEGDQVVLVTDEPTIGREPPNDRTVAVATPDCSQATSRPGGARALGREQGRFRGVPVP